MPGGQRISESESEEIKDKYDSISVLINNRDGTFGNQQWHSTGSHPQYVEVIDINNDNLPDILTTNGGTDDLSVLLNRGDGTFMGDVRFDLGPEAKERLTPTDMNNDGFIDVIVTCGYESTDISVLLNTGIFY